MTTTDGRSDSNRRSFLKYAGAAGIAALAGCITGGGGGGGGDGGDTGTTTGGTGTGTGTGDGGGGGGDGGDGGGGGTQRLSWHAGGTGGTYFPLSNEFKRIVEEYTNYTLQVQSTGASVENVGSLANGSADFALIQNDIAYFARNGTGLQEFQGNAVQNLRGVATLYPETIHVVALKRSGIQTLTDLKGKRINTGDLGSGTQVNALQILEAVGITKNDFTEQNSGFSTAADQLKNGDVDAVFVVGGWPVGAIEDLATTNNITIVEIKGDARQTVKESASWFADDTIPGGTYNGISQDKQTVSVQAMIATRSQESADVVENVTAAIFDHTDELTIKKQFITKESAQDGMSIELHEGAKRYFGG